MPAERVPVNQSLGFGSPLHPVASPTDPYYQVKADTVQLGGGGDFQDLAHSIGLATPVLQKALSDEQKFQQDQQIKAGAVARLTNQKSFKDAQAAGLIRPAENPWFIKGYMQQDGRLSGMNYDIAMRTAWMSDPSKNSDNPQDFAKFQADFRKKWIQENDGKTPDWMDGFAPKMAQADNNLAAQHVAYRQSIIEQTQKDNTGIEISKSLAEMTDVLNAPETRMLPGGDAAVRQSYTDRFTALGRELVAKGMSGKDFNNIVAEQTMAFAKKVGDESLLAIGANVQTGSGSLGQIAHINAQFVEADHQIRSQRYQDLVQAEHIATTPDRAAARQFALDSQAHSRKEWEHQQQSEDRAEATRGYLSDSINNWMLGKADDPAKMRELITVNPQAYEWFQNFKHTREQQKASIVGDQQLAARMMMRVDRDSSSVTLQDIYGQVHEGGLNYEQANSIFAKWHHNNLAENSAANKDPIFKDAYDGLTSAVVGNPMNAAGESRFNAHQAGAELRDFYNETVKDKNLPESEKKKLIREKSLELLTHYNKSAAERTVAGKLEADRVRSIADADAQAQKIRDNTHAQTTGGKVPIPQASINMLRQRPETIATFEKNYGLRPGEGKSFLDPNWAVPERFRAPDWIAP